MRGDPSQTTYTEVSTWNVLELSVWVGITEQHEGAVCSVAGSTG